MTLAIYLIAAQCFCLVMQAISTLRGDGRDHHWMAANLFCMAMVLANFVVPLVSP